jgi:hypothetical protein
MGKDVWLNFALEEVLTGAVLDLTLDLLFNLDLICAALPCTGRGLAGLKLPFLPVGALVAFLRFDRAGALGVLFLTLACDFFVAMALQTYSTCKTTYRQLSVIHLITVAIINVARSIYINCRV